MNTPYKETTYPRKGMETSLYCAHALGYQEIIYPRKGTTFERKV